MSTFFNIYKVTVDLNLLLDNFFLQRAGDTPLLLTKNEIMALKKLVFSTVQKTFKIARVKDDFTAQSLCRITSATLDPSKHWYLLLMLGMCI